MARAFQSTRPVWGATTSDNTDSPIVAVSIHAPRVGRDTARHYVDNFGVVSIHAPRVGRDQSIPCMCPRWLFQSTRPVWGATVRGEDGFFYLKFQSTRPVWGATTLMEDGYRYVEVSIHAPRVGRDFAIISLATYFSVSIHAPRVGRDPRL